MSECLKYLSYIPNRRIVWETMLFRRHKAWIMRIVLAILADIKLAFSTRKLGAKSQSNLDLFADSVFREIIARAQHIHDSHPR